MYITWLYSDSQYQLHTAGQYIWDKFELENGAHTKRPHPVETDSGCTNDDEVEMEKM